MSKPRRAPIDRLVELLQKKGFACNREYLSWMLGRGGITPEFLLEQTRFDEVYELAQEIAEELAPRHGRRAS